MKEGRPLVINKCRSQDMVSLVSGVTPVKERFSYLKPIEFCDDFRPLKVQQHNKVVNNALS